jgi:hypothetical protein
LNFPFTGAVKGYQAADYTMVFLAGRNKAIAVLHSEHFKMGNLYLSICEALANVQQRSCLLRAAI